jgi:hypothetical protein
VLHIHLYCLPANLKLPVGNIKVDNSVTTEMKTVSLVDIANYFRSVETQLDTHNFHVIHVGDFNTAGFDWNHRLPHANSHHYSKLKRDVIFTSTCLLDLRQRIDAAGGGSLLDLAFY